MAGKKVSGLADIFDAYVVEQDCFRPVVERLPQFFERAHFDFDGLAAAPVVDGALESRDCASGQRDVIALDEDAVGKIQAVILASAAADGILINHAQAGRGFTDRKSTR